MRARHRNLRRLVSAVLIFAGAAMLFGAVETVGGLVAIAAGIAIELVGIALEKRPQQDRPAPPSSDSKRDNAETPGRR
jgi:hypothetical protein